MDGSVALNHITFQRNMFGIEVEGTQWLGIAAVRGLHMSAPKQEIPSSPRRVFVPGTPEFDDIRLEVAGGSAGAATAADLNLWIDQMDNAPEADNTRDANVTLKKPNGQVAAIVRLFDLLPLTALEPYSSASGRGITLDLGHFDFQQ